MRTSSRTKQISLALAPFVMLVAIVYGQVQYDRIVALRFDLHAPVHRSILPASIVRHLAFGFDNMLADYYWATAVQNFLKWDRFDQYFPEYFRIISTLDPAFEYPYLFAILTVPYPHNPESEEWLSAIAQSGTTALPHNYQIPFTAASQFYLVFKDNKRAIKYLEIADANPDASAIVHRSYAIYLMRDASDYKKSRALFEAMLETSDNEESKRILSERIALLDLIEVFDQGIAKYKASFGSYPASVDVLLTGSAHPVSENVKNLIKKFAPRIDQTTGKILLR